MIRKRNVLLILCVLTKAVLYSDDTNEETLNRLLKDAVTISVHSRIVIHDSEDYWESDLKKVTIPGRTVTLIFETENEKLSIELTPFKIDEESYMLTAMSNFWREAIDGVQFRSSFKSINLQLEELILFYPLGLKTQEALTGGSLYMELGIKIIPFEREKEISE
ncbi:MAG: hypothetical protein JEY91_00810 [Spirochaetaceae bacterium]|nr:hypothetical protein [Spirochaetaceae bacterium]